MDPDIRSDMRLSHISLLGLVFSSTTTIANAAPPVYKAALACGCDLTRSPTLPPVSLALVLIFGALIMLCTHRT